MSVLVGTKENFQKEVLESKQKVLVDFNATWCGPCRMIGPILEDLSNQRNDVKFVSINVDDEEDIAREYHIFSIPCLVVMENGKETTRSVGFIPKEKIEELIGE